MGLLQARTRPSILSRGRARRPRLAPPGSVPVISLASARRDAIRGEVVSAPARSERSAQSTKPCRAEPSPGEAVLRSGLPGRRGPDWPPVGCED